MVNIGDRDSLAEGPVGPRRVSEDDRDQAQRDDRHDLKSRSRGRGLLNGERIRRVD